MCAWCWPIDPILLLAEFTMTTYIALLVLRSLFCSTTVIHAECQYYNLCWELLAKWAINQLQLCLLVQCTFAIQYQMQQINISYFLFSFSYTLIHSWWTIFLGAWPLFIIKLFHRCYNLDTIESLSAQKREQAGKSFDVYSHLGACSVTTYVIPGPIRNQCSIVFFSLACNQEGIGITIIDLIFEVYSRRRTV